MPGDNEIAVRSFAGSDAIPKWMPETAEEISQRPEVRRELERSAGESQRNQISARGTDKFWFVTYLVVLIGCVVLYIALGSGLIPVSQVTTAFVQRLLRGIAAVIFLLGLAKAISVYLLGQIEDPSTRFTLRRIEHLIVAILIALVAISVTIKNWYAALTALGIGSIILGLAVQTPMTSFIGWIYILVRRPYQVGDRIKIDDATGDVIDVSYLDTTLWEFGGQYISGDHPSGRVIKFPNSKVLNSIVYNYSWPLFPYIWNEIAFHVAYGADLQFIADTMQRITEKELGEEMLERVEVFREVLARTPVDELEVQERPRVIFRVNDNTWLEAIVRYVVQPREAGRVKTRLIKELLAALNAEPDKVKFPKGDAR